MEVLKMRLIAIGLIAMLFLVGSVAAMDMDFDSGREYGQHVRMHAQEMGFTGDHNPGVMHQGYSPWASGLG
jgi:hypothetical protein